MAMASVVYNSYKRAMLDNTPGGDINLMQDTIKCMLVTDSYTPDQDAHTVKADVTNEVTGTGYTAGGKVLTVTVSQDNADDMGVFDAADISWTGSTISAEGCVIYKDTGAASTSPLVCAVDFGETKVSVGGTLEIVWSSDGIVNLR